MTVQFVSTTTHESRSRFSQFFIEIRSKVERYDRYPRTHGYQWPYPLFRRRLTRCDRFRSSKNDARARKYDIACRTDPGCDGNSSRWSLRRPRRASEPSKIALNHSATGAPRACRSLNPQPHPTFRFKLDFSKSYFALPVIENFDQNFRSHLLSKPSPIDFPTSNYPGSDVAGSWVASPCSPVTKAKSSKNHQNSQILRTGGGTAAAPRAVRRPRPWPVPSLALALVPSNLHNHYLSRNRPFCTGIKSRRPYCVSSFGVRPDLSSFEPPP